MRKEHCESSMGDCVDGCVEYNKGIGHKDREHNEIEHRLNAKK